MKSKYINPKYLPPRLPLQFTALVLLILDRFDAAGWIWGVAGSFLALAWIGALAMIYKCEFVKPSEV